MPAHGVRVGPSAVDEVPAGRVQEGAAPEVGEALEDARPFFLCEKEGFEDVRVGLWYVAVTVFMDFVESNAHFALSQV